MENALSRGEDINVIADLRGTRSAPHSTIVCAHYDAHDISQGAADNASGTAAALEVARALVAVRDELRGDVTFAFFGSEELGKVGSHAYAAARAGRLDRIRFLFNLDAVGSAPPLRFMLQNAPGLVPFFERAFAGLPVEREVQSRLVAYSDHFPFVLRGVPCAFLTGSARGWGHTAADTMEKVPLSSLSESALLAARLVARVDRADPWPGVRRSPAEVEAAVTEAGLADLLRYEGRWPPAR